MQFGRIEIALAGIAGLLIAGGSAAVLGRLGPYVTIVALAYFLAVGAASAVYRRARIEATAVAEAERQAPAGWVSTVYNDYSVARSSDLLSGLTDEQAAEVLEIAQWHAIPAGTPLAVAGAPGEWVYIIINGAVELTARSSVGEVTVRIARGGEALPLAAILGTGELVTSATAMTDLIALAIPRLRLLALCGERPQIGMTIFRTTAEILTERYRSTLRRHLEGVSDAVRQPELWANV